MSDARFAALCLALAALVAACSPAAGPSPGRHPGGTVTLATFEGDFDPQTGVMSLRPAPGPGDIAAVVLPAPVSDGRPGVGPDDTFELVTEATPAPGVVVDGCSPGVPSFEGSITLRSFFVAQTFSNVYLQLTDVSPSGHEACNSDTDPLGVLDGFLGLWSYGSLGTRGAPTSAVTVRWKFNYPSSERFTFHGRIMGDWNTPPEFNWIPNYVDWAPARFQEVATTIGHIVWNSDTQTFEDVARGIEFVPDTTPAADNPVDLWTPALHYGGPFGGGAFYVADAAHGGNAINTSGTFTVCVKFKPGLLPSEVPGMTTTKVILGKGQANASWVPPPAYEGWALLEMMESYSFQYAVNSNEWVVWAPQAASPSPSTFAYDYFCAGRNANIIQGAAHGRDVTFARSITGTFTAPENLPLVIGAYPDGTDVLDDGGVYEAIFDRRAPTPAVMLGIVEAAEADALPGSASAIYVPPLTPLVSAPAGSLPAGQGLPVYATTPLPGAASGLLQEGVTARYKRPLVENTTSTGFCAGVLLTADGAWSNVSGGILEDGFRLLVNGMYDTLEFIAPAYDFWNQTTFSEAVAGWADGSTHTIQVCADSFTNGPPDPQASLYLDGVLHLATPLAADIPDLSNAANQLLIGDASDIEPLSGARIRRVFMCPTSDVTSCN